MRQLCFFRFPKPLLERFGADFFKDVPKQPGVYLFAGARHRILYVGQSHNLKIRLSYYKNAQPEREPRKIIKLVHQTESITWECCDSPEAAQLRELELIREHRPRFNVAHMLTPTYTFFGLSVNDGALRIRIALRNEPAENETWFGAYKNHGLCRRAFMVIGRMLWAENNPVSSIYDFPLWLHDSARHREWAFAVSDNRSDEICSLLNGQVPSILDRLQERVTMEKDLFLKKLWEQDFLTLTEFYDLASRLKTMREFHSLSQPIEQSRVDELLFRMRHAEAVSKKGETAESGEDGALSENA